MSYLNAMPASWEPITSKKQLKELAATKPNFEFILTDVQHSGQTATMQELPAGTKVSMTNHPKRSWFATIELKNGVVKVT